MSIDLRRARPTAPTTLPTGDVIPAEERGTRRSSAAPVEGRWWHPNAYGPALTEEQLFWAYSRLAAEEAR